jgi:protocatechuate 3,4-dioxygenase beta subunit
MTFSIRTVAALAIAAAAGLGACDGGTDPQPGDAARIEVIAGSGQEGTVAQPLPQPVQVRVVDAAGRPVPDEVVNFVVTGGGGTVSVGSMRTNADGVAATVWTLGTRTGVAQTLEARIGTAGGQTIVSDPVTAGTRAGAPARAEAATDTMLGGVVGTVLDDTLAIRVLDAHGNLVPGAAVTWTAAGGGGVAPLSAQTDAQGIARALWTLGTDQSQTQLVTAGPVGSARFRARVATLLVFNNEGGVMAPPGSSRIVQVRVRGPAGAVPGVQVRWLVGGGGSVTASGSTRTDTTGTATATWMYGSASTLQTVTAVAGSLEARLSGTAITQGNRTLVVTAPGNVLDVDETRIVWTSGYEVYLRERGTTTDVHVSYDARSTRLFPGGVLLHNSLGLWMWKNGTLSSLEDRISRYVVDGEWVAWSTDNRQGNNYIVRRNLRLGGTDSIASASGHVLQDVGPTGDVAAIRAGGSVLTIFSGGTSRDVASGVWSAVIDGTDVVYATYSGSEDEPPSVWREEAGEDLLLASPVGTFAYAGGWLGFTGGVAGTLASANVFRRNPQGAVEQLTFDLAPKRVEAVGPTGWVLFHSQNPYSDSYRRLLSVPGRPLVMTLADSESLEQVVWRTDRFLLLSGRSVYELTP